VTVGAALRQGSEMLERAGRESVAMDVPRLTAEVLLAHALHCDRAWLYAHSFDELPERAWIHYGRYLNERLQGKPTQYITGIQEFFGRTFRVNPHVLIPRPETEHLVQAALADLEQLPEQTIVDIGTGSGAIAITLALETGRRIFASDLSLDALHTAARNAKTLDANVGFFAGDFLGALKPASVDLIVSNPPYIAERDAPDMQREVRDWEPHGALFAGLTGNTAYETLIAQAQTVLRPGGRLMLELGYNSLDGVRHCLGPEWTERQLIHDLAGWARVLVTGIS
jgi:release factor glutamine methyltransferase